MLVLLSFIHTIPLNAVVRHTASYRICRAILGVRLVFSRKPNGGFSYDLVETCIVISLAYVCIWEILAVSTE